MKMKKIFLGGLFLLFLVSCSNHVDFGEQYKKVVYIVKSDNKVYVRQHKISAEEQEGGISLYCGGSDVLKEDVTVTLVSDEEAMRVYNSKNFDETNQYKKLILLPEEYYTIPSYSVTIKAGTEYTKMPINLVTKNINPDSCYVIPLSIGEISQYEVNEKLKTIFYQIELINDYSGNCVGTLKNIKGEDTTFTAKDKVLKAIDEQQIRTSIYNLNAEYEFLGTNFMVLTVGVDNKVTIAPWKDAEIEDLGNSLYIPERKTFILHYKCKDASGNVLTIEEDLVNSEAMDIVDED